MCLAQAGGRGCGLEAAVGRKRRVPGVRCSGNPIRTLPCLEQTMVLIEGCDYEVDLYFGLFRSPTLLCIQEHAREM